MIKKLLSFFILFLLSAAEVLSYERPNFVSLSQLVVGNEEWNLVNQSPLAAPSILHDLTTPSALPINWYLRYDAIKDNLISDTIKQYSSSYPDQQIGAFLEITPDLIKDSNLKNRYRFLSSYQNKDRKIIIDQFMKAFFNTFGSYPQTVFLSHTDPISTSYLNQKYLVTSILIEGQNDYSLPYTPNIDNPYMPSFGSSQTLPVVISQWSGQSIKPNDLNQFTYKNIGLDNTTAIEKYQKITTQIVDQLTYLRDKKEISLTNQNDFARWFVNRYKNASPVYFFEDVSSTGNRVFHYQSYLYRLDILTNKNKTNVANFKVFLPKFTSDYKYFPSFQTPLVEDLPTIDDFQIEHDLSKAKIELTNNTVVLTTDKGSVALSPEKIILKDFGTLNTNSKYLYLKNTNSSQEYHFDQNLPYSKKSPIYFLLIILVLLLFFLFKTPVMGLLFALPTTLTVVFSGLVGDMGMGFYGPNGHDAVFHLSLIEHFKKDFFSLSHPQYSTAVLQNYHFAVDYILAILSKITGVSSIDWYFRLWPLFVLLFLVLGLNKLFDRLSFNQPTRALSYFLCFFGSSLGFFANIIVNKRLFGGESIFWSNQPVSYFLNPPLITSLAIMVWFLVFLNSKNFLASVFLGSILAPTKIYSFFLLVTSLFLSKKFKLGVLISILGFILLLPTLSLNRAVFEFNPLWFPRSMFESLDHLYIERISSAWQAYENSGNLLKVALLNFFGLFIFVIGNLGFRLFGLISKPKNTLEKLILVISIFGIVIPLTFTQAINPWNSIQFLYYSQFFLAILAAPILINLSKPWIIILIVATNILGPVGTIRDYLSTSPSSRISLVELDVLSRFSQFPSGLVVSPIFESITAKKVPEPRNLYAYVSTAYISALTPHRELLSDTINLDITFVRYQDLANNIIRLYQTKDESYIIKFLQENKVGYLYETPLGKLSVDPNKVCLSKIIGTSEVNIYKFQCQQNQK